MKDSERVRKVWRDTVGLLAIVAAAGACIAAYDIWRSIRETGSADWKLWLAALVIIPAALLFLGFTYPIMRVLKAWVDHKERW